MEFLNSIFGIKFAWPDFQSRQIKMATADKRVSFKPGH